MVNGMLMDPPVGLAPSVDALLAVDPYVLDAEAIADHFRGLRAAHSRLDAAELAAVRALEALEIATKGEGLGPAHWIARHTGAARSEAGGRVRLAGYAEHMPLSAAALEAGEISLDHLRVLARCVGPKTRDQFTVDEPTLLARARETGVDELAKSVEYWLDRMRPEEPERRDPAEDDVAFIKKKLGGRWRLTADFGILGAELNAALQQKGSELFHADRRAGEADPTDPIATRGHPQRVAAALFELVGLGAAADDQLTDRRRPAITAVVDQPTICGRDTENPIHETDDGTVLSRQLLEMWLCDCSLARVVLGADSMPINLGRAVRTPSAAQRRALVVRDRGCVVPGCERPPAWCDAHHVPEWEHGGRTDLDAMALLCRHHHGRVHGGHITVEMVGGHPEVRRSDGTLIPPLRPSTATRGSPRPPGSRGREGCGSGIGLHEYADSRILDRCTPSG